MHCPTTVCSRLCVSTTVCRSSAEIVVRASLPVSQEWVEFSGWRSPQALRERRSEAAVPSLRRSAD